MMRSEANIKQSRVAQRPNPQINLGPIDCSAAIIVCDMSLPDNPIIYCSEAFCELTGYSYSDVLGRNCRFLQAPDAANAANKPATRGGTESFDEVHVPGGPSQKIDLADELHRLKHSLSHNEEAQVVLLNYKKSGKAFLNLVTVIPMAPDGEDHQYLVGFQAASAQPG